LRNAELSQGPNLYLYCGNNPVLYKDDDGRWIAQAVGLVVGAGINAVQNYSDYDSGKITGFEYGASIVTGGLYGVLSTLAPGIGGGALLGGLSSGANSITNDLIKGDCIDVDGALKSVALGAAVGGVAGVVEKVAPMLVYIPNPMGKVVGSTATQVKRLNGETSGIVADAAGSVLSEDW
jgi:hypothetical protein